MLKRTLTLLLTYSLMLGQGSGSAVDLTRPRWNGRAICYSGYRAGQNPDRHRYPTQAQVLEDLTILQRKWQIIRLYGSDPHSRDVLACIRQHALGLKVVLGIWLSGKPEKQAENPGQIAYAIQLAKEYPDIVAAVSVGNEALVSWSDHRMAEAALIAAVEQVKAAVACPVSVADDFLYWIQPGNRLARHLDFIILHTYPMWGHQDIDQAFRTTVTNYKKVRRAYPHKTIVLGEVGWASQTDADPRHVPGAGSEAKQKRYFEEIDAWARKEGVTTFFFEAFDEPWKGTGTEGHWGLFTADRKAKAAVAAWYPDLKPAQPTPAPEPPNVPAQGTPSGTRP